MYAVLDIETTGLNRYKHSINFIGVAEVEDFLAEPVYDYFDMTNIMGVVRFKEWCKKAKENKYKMIYQNGKFDTLFIEVHHKIVLPIHHDVMLMGTAYDLASEHGLKAMAKQYLGVPDWDISTKDKTSKDLNVVKPYLKLDLKNTWELFKWLSSRLSDSPVKMRIYEKLLKPAYKMYRKVERRGIYLNQQKLMEVKHEYKEQERILLAQLKKIHDINWNSPKQVQHVLYEIEKLPVYKRSERTGEASADAKTLKRLALKGYKIAEMLLEYKFYYGANTKFLNSWSEYVKYDGRIHPSFNITNVVTGRTSCSDPNLQQVPRNPELRSMYDAKPGYSLIEADYSQIELRIAGHYANEPTMLKIYQTGGDIHTETGMSLVKPGEQFSKEHRSKAKAVNFGFLYGMSAKGFTDYAFDSYGVIFSKTESEEYRDRFFNKYDRLLPWHKEMEETCKLLGGVDNLFGRFRALPDIYSNDSWDYGNAKRRAINTPVQSTASDILLCSAIEIDADLDPKYDAGIVGTVHDSILIEVKTEYVEQACKDVQRIMSHPKLLDEFNIKLRVPIEADVGVGPWGSK